MKTSIYFLALSCCMLLFACNNEEKVDAATRADAVEEEVAEVAENPICFSCMSIEQAADAYNYPLKLGSEELKNASPSDKIDKNQIPDNVLKTMSTKGLVQSLLTFPTILDWTFMDNYYNGFLQQTERITIFKELYSRNDAATCLLNIYKSFDQYACQGGELTMQTMDMLIAQPEIYTKFTDKEITELFETAINKIESLREVNEEGVLWWFGGDKYLFMGKIMYYVGYKPFVASVDANEYLLNYLEKTDASFLLSISQYGGPEKFHEFFMTHAKTFLDQRK